MWTGTERWDLSLKKPQYRVVPGHVVSTDWLCWHMNHPVWRWPCKVVCYAGVCSLGRGIACTRRELARRWWWYALCLWRRRQCHLQWWRRCAYVDLRVWMLTLISWTNVNWDREINTLIINTVLCRRSCAAELHLISCGSWALIHKKYKCFVTKEILIHN